MRGGRGLCQAPQIKLETCVARVISIQLYTEAIGRCGDDGILSDIHNRRVYGLREGRKTRKTSVSWCKPNVKEKGNAFCRCCLVCSYCFKRSP